MRSLLASLFVCCCICLYSQGKHKSISELADRISSYGTRHEADSAFICISKFLERPGIDTVELFYGHLLFGQTYFDVKDVKEGFSQMDECIRLTCSNKAYLKYLYRTYLAISEEYFTLQRFDSARVHALKSLAISSQVKPADLYDEARCYNILGYCAYLDKKYPEAITNFQKSVFSYEQGGNLCEVPLVYCKMAKVYNALNDKSMAERLITEAICISDSCRLENNILVCKYARLEIYKENHEYEKALASLEDINVMVEKMDIARKIDRVNELEVKYKTKLKDYENNSLKQINLKNGEVLSKQKLALIVSIAAILIMLALSVLMVRISRQRKSALMEIEHKNREIENKNKDLERLHLLNQKIFSVISHDFKGPMLSLQLMLNALEKENTNPALSRYTHDVSNQLMNANQMLDNLLNWARTEINIHMSSDTSANPYQVAGEIAAQFGDMAAKKNVRIANNIAPSLSVCMPPDVLRIVFRNLISNAIKYSFENSDVQLYNEGHTITVKDLGIGMNGQKLNNLFLKDVEASLGTWQEAGFGLGMYITSELLHRYGGHIKAQGHKDGGTEFMITFPEDKNHGKP